MVCIVSLLTLVYANQEIRGYIESCLVSGRNYTKSAEVSDSTLSI